MTTTASKLLPSIYCSAEWHLRKNPRAIAIYNLGLRLTEGGTNDFFMSQPQLANYFGWCIKAIRKAFNLLTKSGLLVLVAKGRGGDVRQQDFANRYRVLTHSELSGNGEHACYVKPERPRAQNDPRSKETSGTKGTEPQGTKDRSPRAQLTTLVSDLSTKYLASDSAENRALRAYSKEDGYTADDWVREEFEQKLEIVHSLPQQLTTWIASLKPLALPSPLSEKDAAAAFAGVNDALFISGPAIEGEDLHGAARLFGTARGSHWSLLDYQRIWALDQKFGAGTSVAVAQKILELMKRDEWHPISIDSFIWNHIADQLIDA
jgi:hypothetical protein